MVSEQLRTTRLSLVSKFLNLTLLKVTTTGGDMASTWVLKLQVHAEGQTTSLNQL